jgi:hypothetical protein
VRRCTVVVEDTRRRVTDALNTTGEKRSCHVGSATILGNVRACFPVVFDAVKRSLPPPRFVIDRRLPRVRGSGLHHMWVRLIILVGRPADAAWVHDQSA